MEMHQIRYFLTVAETLNFTHAADACNVAQPSLSRAIKKLEAELEGELFRRERGLTHLTELGRLMLQPLSTCLESASAAKDMAKKFKKDGMEPLRIAISNSIELQLLQHPLSELVQAFPGIELQVSRGSAEKIAEKIKSGEAEIAVACPLPDAWERLEAWELFCESFKLVAHNQHPISKNNAVTLRQISETRLLPRRYCEQ
nr:LysR family transcriptional regulator [Alphaproteobacteria bacterium]